MSYSVKKLEESDNIQEALAVVWEVFQQFEAPEYSDEGIEEFRNTIQYENILQLLREKKWFLWAAYENNRIVGVIGARLPSHISLLFVNPQYHRRGIARTLFETVLEVYKGHGKKEITVNSSPYAVQIYRHLGFTETATEQIVNGIRFTPMKYIIV